MYTVTLQDRKRHLIPQNDFDLHPVLLLPGEKICYKGIFTFDQVSSIPNHLWWAKIIGVDSIDLFNCKYTKDFSWPLITRLRCRVGVRNKNLPIMCQATVTSKRLQTLHSFLTTPWNSDYLVISLDLIRHYTHTHTHGTSWHLEDYPQFPTY